MVKVKLRRLDILSSGLVSCLYALVIGVISFLGIMLLMSVIVSLLGAVGGSASSLVGSSMGFYALFFFILYPIFGFIGGIIGALIYNSIARIMGGLKFELDELE